MVTKRFRVLGPPRSCTPNFKLRASQPGSERLLDSLMAASGPQAFSLALRMFFLKNAILDTNILNKEIIDENTDFWLLFKSCSWGSTMHMMQPGSRHATALLDNSSAFHFEVCVFPHRSPHRTGANEGQRDFLLPEALPSTPGGNILWVPACSAPCMFLKSPLFMPTPRWGSSHKWWWKRH